MRAAKQQANELENIGGFLNGVLAPDGSPIKDKHESHTREGSQSRQLNGKAKSIRTDHLARFADPPAPPPQQPLPEKPDSAKSSPINPASISNLLKRSETAKAGGNTGNSPTSPHNSQMLQLVEALTHAKKELDSQAARVKQLEDMLNEERSARVDAEERARKLEQNSASRPVANVEEVPDLQELVEKESGPTEEQQDSEPEKDPTGEEHNLQQKFDHMVAEMQRMRADVEKFKRRADTAESDASKARESLAEMIERLRQENSREILEVVEVEPLRGKTAGVSASSSQTTGSSSSNTKAPGPANGHIRTPKLPAHLEHAVTTILREGNHGNGEILANSAPYVSMLGVVLIGVGLMAYLNSWQKSER